MKTSQTPIEQVLPKPIGIWIRVSTDEQAQGDSPAHHEARARHFAAAKGWLVRELYDLAGVSGKTVYEHPECKRMMEDIRRGHITGLVFSKLARFARNARELMDFSDFFRQNNADLISLQENIDTSTPSGRLFYNMVACMAQWEREEIADRVKASISIRAKLGKPLNGKAPYGYHWKEKKLLPHPDEAPVRKLMYELYLQHGRKKAVARILNERGYRTRDGSKFSDTSVDRLIQDPTAKGVHRSNYTRRVGDNLPWALKPEHEWIFNPVPAIISSELWQQCNDMLETRKNKLTRPGKRPVQIFAGLTFCKCGKKMYVPSHSPKYVCTACHNKIPIVDLEGIFLDELKNYLLSPDKVSAYLAGATNALSEKTRLLETLQKEHQKVKAEMDRTHELYIAGGLTVPQFKERYQPLDDRKNQILAELPRAEAEIDLLKINGLTSEHIMSEVRDLHARWPKMNTDERRKIVELLVKDIQIGEGEITFNLSYRPSYEEVTIRQRML
jgi:site-specific DNA recombinase